MADDPRRREHEHDEDAPEPHSGSGAQQEEAAEDEDAAVQQDEAPALLTVAFRPEALRWSIRIDGALRGLLLLAVIGAAMFVFVFEGGADTWSAAAVLAVLIVWLMVNSISARVSRELPTIGALLDVDPHAAEDRIARALRRRPLLRWVRLMLCHRLAALRHRQQRFGESAVICQAVLDYPLGPAAQTRPHLLLMLAEARMQLGQAAAAYEPLRELHATKLSLAEQLQRLALQTRYEVLIGRPAEAVRDLKHKVELAELMPAAQCGTMHAILATAARQTRQTEVAAWLWARAQLLLSPAQLTHVAAGRFGVAVDAATPTVPAA